MFTGIIEAKGIIKKVSSAGSNLTFKIESPLSSVLKVDQSVSHDGVCLTIEATDDNVHQVTAIAETIDKTTAGAWKKGTIVNLERCLTVSARVDGHFVQGHVDATGKCIKRKDKKGSWEYTFSYPKKMAELVIEKGSVSVNGISLTAFKVTRKTFTVAIIPYTFEHTNMHAVTEGTEVNLEFDLLGKYILRKLSLKAK